MEKTIELKQKRISRGVISIGLFGYFCVVLLASIVALVFLWLVAETSGIEPTTIFKDIFGSMILWLGLYIGLSAIFLFVVIPERIKNMTDAYISTGFFQAFVLTWLLLLFMVKPNIGSYNLEEVVFVLTYGVELMLIFIIANYYMLLLLGGNLISDKKVLKKRSVYVGTYLGWFFLLWFIFKLAILKDNAQVFWQSDFISLSGFLLLYTFASALLFSRLANKSDKNIFGNALMQTIVFMLLFFTFFYKPQMAYASTVLVIVIIACIYYGMFVTTAYIALGVSGLFAKKFCK